MIADRGLDEDGPAGSRARSTADLRVFRSVVREEAKTCWLRYRLLILSAVLPTAAACGIAVALARPGQPVTAFVYTYPFGANHGLRAWTLDGSGRWHERGPDGREARLFDVTTRDTVNGCRGSLTGESAQRDFKFFVPDVGCRAMALLLKRGDGAWTTLGPMTIVSGRTGENR